jgi:hypothetical protein
MEPNEKQEIMLTPTTPNTPLSMCIDKGKCTSQLTMPEDNTGAELFLTEPQYFNSAKQVSIVGILGGEINRTTKELVGRVLQQRKIFRNPDEAAEANARATKIATDFTLRQETLDTGVAMSCPKFLAASFSFKQGNYFRQILDWMLKNKVDVLVAMEDWMDEIIRAYSLMGSYVMTCYQSEYPGVTIWMVENPFEKLFNNSLNEQHLFSDFSEQHQRLREVHRPELEGGGRLGFGIA